MIKRKANVFGSSSDSDSDSEYHKSVNTKRKKIPPIFDAIKNSDSHKHGCETEQDGEEDYMKYSAKNDGKDGDDEPNPRRFEGMKYDEVQQFKREEALKQSLFTDKFAKKSIGLSIMEKMGFKVGDSLGSSKMDKRVLTKPIDVQIKTNRLGVGASNKNNQLEPQAKVDVLEYRERIQKSKENSKIGLITNKAMKLCFELSGDSEEYYNDKEIFKPQEVNILWRPYVIDMIEKDLAKMFKQKVIRIDEDKESVSGQPATSNKEETDKEYELYLLSEPLDKLEKLLNYMRDNYNYCFYCGFTYKNQGDLIENCPGVYEEDHLDL
ncbi:uncharacterized protein AC631_02358 [Debaryomyces fabryi]|uniref:G-patch domain-containing protein n=1 Tax=Debaryomyces fabryi TaxID=58627 RepID=A0A0V1Q054_9ASCO|nr:uncharacterized protein AC631_02358 [Debaryomyces fabryi]KSA01902.1 hypothetical protein AC631_02358 [Debaryomyces fabryi]CUM53561.1 unnamed protein product [Debaryomyces fabryi]